MRRISAVEEELGLLREAILRARERLEEAQHPRMLEAAAYEMKYLEARQAYLLELARSSPDETKKEAACRHFSFLRRWASSR